MSVPLNYVFNLTNDGPNEAVPNSAPTFERAGSNFCLCRLSDTTSCPHNQLSTLC
jgi:hypothetical protein